MKVSPVQFIGRAVDVPVIMPLLQRQVPQTHGVLKTVKVSTVQFIDRVVKAPVIMQMLKCSPPRERTSLEAERDRLRKLVEYMSGHGFGGAMHHGTDA